MIDKIKNSIKEKKDKVLRFRYNGSRNQIEEFQGIIVGVYNYIFTIRLLNSSEIKSFSYSDVLIKKIEIY